MLPIFRHGEIQVLTPVEPKPDGDLLKLTFIEWLDYYLRLPSHHKGLYTEQQYVDLLHACTGSQSIAEQMADRSEADNSWVYNQISTGTFESVRMSYQVSNDRIDTGPVLVTFVQPADNKGEAFQKRPPLSQDALSLGMMRRCVPFSLLMAATELSHRGPQQSGHIGQDNTW